MATQIFISYRRDGGEWFAHLMYDRLHNDGYDVFLDVESLRSGKFNEALYKKIRECKDFLLILPPNGLERCKNEDDWVRLEIECAIKENKNIVPIMLRNFEFPNNLPESLKDLPNYNGIEASSDLFTEALLKLKEKRLESKPNKQCVINKNMASEDKHDEVANFDKEMDEKFEELFSSSTEDDKKIVSPLVKKITKVRGEHFFKEIVKEDKKPSEDRVTIFEEDISLFPEICKNVFEYDGSNKHFEKSENGQHFSLYEPKGITSSIFLITNKMDYKTLEKYPVCEQLDFVNESEHGEGCNKIFFIDKKTDKGKQLIILHFNLNKNEVAVNMGIIENDVIRISKAPMFMNYSDNLVRLDEERDLNNVAFNMDDISDEEKKSLSGNKVDKWLEADIRDDVCIIIDPDTGEPVKRELYYDENTKERKARIKIFSHKHYFVFKMQFDDGVYRKPLSNLEIAKCYCKGSYNFPKDLLKSVEYYEKDGTGEALYSIARLFRSEEDFEDEAIYREYLDKAVEMGYESAILEKILGLICSGKNCEDIKKLFEKLNNSESGIANFVKGYLIEFGYIAGTNEDAFSYYYQSAENSYEPALTRICIREKVNDKDLIYKFFLNNQEYGKTIAQYCMGCILYFGLDVFIDKKEALKFLKKAAEKGNRVAAYALFFIYDVDVEYKDKEIALFWFKEIEKVAEERNLMATRALYNIYDNSEEFKNEEKALQWLKEAEKNDSTLTVTLSNKLLEGKGCKICKENDKVAFELLQKACANANLTAKNNLAWMLKKGRGCKLDYEKARKLFEEAAEEGSVSSLCNLGDMYEKGLGVPQNYEMAISYYQQAAELGSEKAVKKLEELKTKKI